MMKKETLFVRIGQKNGPTQFMRCGTMFGRAWKRLEDVDAATRKRLEAEQMLELTTEEPDDYTADEDSANALSGELQATDVTKLQEQAQAAAIKAENALKEAEAKRDEARALASDAAKDKAEAQELREKAEADAKVAAELRQEAESLRKDGSADTSKDSSLTPAAKNQKGGK